VTLVDGRAVAWLVGEEKATAILDRLQERTQQVRTLLERERRQREALDVRWRETIGDRAAQFTSPAVALKRYAIAGNWSEAFDEAEAYARTHQAGAPRLYSAAAGLADTYGELSRIQGEQRADIDALVPSQIDPFFWTSPAGTVIEVWLFALFGVLTNLLVNSAEFLRKGLFRPAEQQVGWTKLVYGPVLAVILVLAILVGWLDLGDYETRATTLPLAGFVFGYAARRTVALFDGFVTRLLGSAADSIRTGPGRIAARRAAFLDRYADSLRPRSLAALRADAREIADAQVKTAVLARKETEA
jgi:hypothetical protein